MAEEVWVNMECKNCGSPDAATCGCGSLDLLGFLSDFRTAQAPAPEPVHPSRAAWTRPASAAAEAEQEELYYAETEGSADPGEPAPSEPHETQQPPAYEIPVWPPPPPAGGPASWPPPAPGLAPPYPFPAPAPAPDRRGPSWAVVAAVIAAVVVVAVGVGAYRLRTSRPNLDAVPAAQILQKSLAAVSRAATAHLTQYTSDLGKAETDSIDITPGGGTIDSTIGTFHASAVSVDGTMYMKADSWVLSKFGFPTNLAVHYGGQWLSMSATLNGIKQAAAELQTPVVVSDLLSLSGPLTRVGPVTNGRVTIQGAIPANDLTNSGNGAGDVATLVISAKSPYYPVSISFADPQNGRTTMTFSGWGHPVDLTPPSNATPIGALIGNAA